MEIEEKTMEGDAKTIGAEGKSMCYGVPQRVTLGSQRMKNLHPSDHPLLSSLYHSMEERKDPPEYDVLGPLGKSGTVFLGKRVGTDEQVALKFLKFDYSSENCSPNPHELNMYWRIKDCYGFPRVIDVGTHEDFHIMVMELLGPNLVDHNVSLTCMSTPLASSIAVNAIKILENLHEKGLVKGGGSYDKVGRFVYRQNPGHFDYVQNPAKPWSRSIQYASVHTHLGRRASRRDDLESLAYTLIFLVCGRLPWEGVQRENLNFLVCKKKVDSYSELMRTTPSPFNRFLEAVKELKFNEKPDYMKLISFFDGLTIDSNTSELPGALKVNFEKDEQPKKKPRLGSCANTQWILVYDARRQRNQRCHHDVADSTMLRQLIDKGLEEGLYIRCVASTDNRWALIMDDVTCFDSQVYDLSNIFLHKDWITSQWKDGYYITSAAGAIDGMSLVVMSRDLPYVQQCYKVCDYFPINWINKKFTLGFHVTSMTTSGSKWVVELDFLYPSEGIRERWKEGYRITSVAATADQLALIFSTLVRENLNGTQETSRTSAFPSHHVEESSSKNLYVASMCYGRTSARRC